MEWRPWQHLKDPDSDRHVIWLVLEETPHIPGSLFHMRTNEIKSQELKKEKSPKA